MNAIAPTRSRPQVSFKLDYSGGYGKYKQDYWKTFKSSCGAYDGPALAWKVTALQGARRLVLGAAGVAAHAAELRCRADRRRRRSGSFGSRTGRATLPVLTIDTDWAWHQWDHLFGTFTYDGQPGLRLPLDARRRPARHVRPQHLRRHVRLGVRRRAGSARTAS